MFKIYQRMLKERKRVVQDIQLRYQEGLEKLRKAQDAIYIYYKQLEAKSPELERQVRELIMIVKEIQDEYDRVKNQRDQLTRDEFEAEQEVEEAARIRD